MADLTYQVNFDTNPAIQSMRRLQSQMDNIDRKFTQVGRTSQNLTNTLRGFAGVIAGVVTGQAVRGIINLTARFEDLETTLGSVFGGARQGAQALDFISDLATKTQFSVEDLTTTFIKLGSAGIQPTEDLIRTFTDAAAVTTDQIGSLQAITDLFARTTSGGLGLEELNRLADRGIPVFAILEQRLGLARLEISEFGKTAEGAQTILRALSDGIQERFGGATQDRLKNLSTLMSNFGIQARNTAVTFGEALAPAVRDVVTRLTDFLEQNDKLAAQLGAGVGEAIRTTADALQLLITNLDLVRSLVITLVSAKLLGSLQVIFARIASSIARATTAAGVFSGALKGLTAGFGSLLGVARANPIGLITSAIIGAVTYFNGFGRTMAQVSAALEYAGNQFRILGEFIINLITTPFRLLYDGLVELGNLLGITGDGASRFGEIVGEALDYVGDKASEWGFIDAIVKAGEEYDALQQKLEQGKKPVEQALTMPEVPGGGQDVLAGGAGPSPAAIANATKMKEAQDALNQAMEQALERYLPVEAATADYEQTLEMLDQALRKGRIDSEQYASAVARLQKEFKQFLETQKGEAETFADGWDAAFERFRDSATDSAKLAEEIFSKTTQSIEDSIVSFVRTGKLSFKDLVGDIAETIFRSQLRQLLVGGVGGAGGGILGGIGDFFAGFFANGGLIPSGKFGVVGERGPELVSGPAQVTPMNGMGGSTTVNYNINAVDTDSFRRLVATDPEFIYGITEQGRRSLPGRR